jgi:histidyl-tRNA synthetase
MAASLRVLVVGVTEDDHAAAIEIAQAIRGLDHVVVEQDVRLRGVKSALRYADRAGISLVAIVGERERADDVVVLRDMRTRNELRVPRRDVGQAVRSALG